MKKLALVLVLVFVFALPVLANPFVDVPLNHWAYDAVQSLAAKGVIVGYPDGTFGGAKSLTRYEFAEAVAKALASVEAAGYASADDVAVLEKLAIEFADELASLGVTVADLEAAVGANSEAIAALEETVAKHEAFFEPLKITGQFRVTYEKDVIPMTTATLVDRTRLWFEAEINDQTKAGIRLQAQNTLSGTPTITWSDFWVDYKGDYLSLRVGDVLPDALGLGLIAYYKTDECSSYNFDGFLAKWTWEDVTDTDLGTWTLFGDVEDYYTLHIATTLGDEDEVTLGVTGSYDVLAAGYAGGADVAFKLGDEDEVSVAAEGAVFYDTTLSALSYAGAAKVSGALDDLSLTVKGYYVQPGFVPTMSDYTADRLGGWVEASYLLTDEVTGVVKYTYEMDTAMAVKTNKVRGTLKYVPEDAAAGENADVYAEYNLLTAELTGFGRYMNYPLSDDFVLSGFAKYTYPSGVYVGAATLEYALAEDMDLSVEGRADSAGVGAIWSAEAQVTYALATNTKLTFGFEMNDWSDDIKDYDVISTCEDLTHILDATSTLKAQLTVSF